MEKHRVAIIAPNVMPLTPENTYGGTERMVKELAEGWAEDDSYDLKLFCAEGSRLQSPHLRICEYPASAYPRDFIDGLMGAEYLASHPQEIRSWYDKSLTIQEGYEDFIVSQLTESSPDIINVHQPTGRLLGKLTSLGANMFVCLHNDPAGLLLPNLEGGLYLTLSDSQDRRVPPASGMHKVVHGAIRLPEAAQDNTDLPLDITDDFLVYVGAMSRRKGVKTAIELSRTMQLPLVLVGPVLAWSPQHLEDTAIYFLREIQPLINGRDVVHLPSLDDRQRNALMNAAAATVVASAHEDSTWQESFGRVVPESLAQGTPVLASHATQGAVDLLSPPAIARFKSAGEPPAAICDKEPAACRKVAEELFDMERYVHEIKAVVTGQAA